MGDKWIKDWDYYKALFKEDFEFRFFVVAVFLVVLPLYSYFVCFDCSAWVCEKTECLGGECVVIESGSLCEKIEEAREEKQKRLDRFRRWNKSTGNVSFLLPAD